MPRKFTYRYALYAGVPVLLVWMFLYIGAPITSYDIYITTIHTLFAGAVGAGIGYFRDKGADRKHTLKTQSHRHYVLEYGLKGIVVFGAIYVFFIFALLLFVLLIFFDCRDICGAGESPIKDSLANIEPLLLLIHPPLEAQYAPIWLADLVVSFGLGVGWGLLRWRHLKPIR